MHHIAYTVARIEDRLADLAAAGLELVDRTPRRGAHDMRIAFLHPGSTGGVGAVRAVTVVGPVDAGPHTFILLA